MWSKKLERHQRTLLWLACAAADWLAYVTRGHEMPRLGAHPAGPFNAKLHERKATHSSSGERWQQSASLSVVIVSSGSAIESQRAAQALQKRLSAISLRNSSSFRRTAIQGLRHRLKLTGAEFVLAPAGCTRAEMCDLGMSQASGAIVAVRDDVVVGDGRWLDTYRAVLPRRESVTMPVESVVMDTMVAGAVARATARPRSRRSRKRRARRRSRWPRRSDRQRNRLQSRPATDSKVSPAPHLQLERHRCRFRVTLVVRWMANPSCFFTSSRRAERFLTGAAEEW